jgi:hypothetical protein
MSIEHVFSRYPPPKEYSGRGMAFTSGSHSLPQNCAVASPFSEGRESLPKGGRQRGSRCARPPTAQARQKTPGLTRLPPKSTGLFRTAFVRRRRVIYAAPLSKVVSCRTLLWLI